MWRRRVDGHLIPLGQLPSLRYVSVTSSWNGKEESVFSDEFDMEKQR